MERRGRKDGHIEYKKVVVEETKKKKKEKDNEVEFEIRREWEIKGRENVTRQNSKWIDKKVGLERWLRKKEKKTRRMKNRKNQIRKRKSKTGKNTIGKFKKVRRRRKSRYKTDKMGRKWEKE